MSSISARLGQAAFAGGLLVALAWGTAPFAEVDSWWHLREGEHILQTWSLVGTDPWASCADRPYVATQWLPEAVAAWLVGAVGLWGVVWLRAVAVIALYLVLYVLTRQPAGRLPASLASAVAVLGAGASLNPRPQLVSFVLFAVVYLAWWRTMKDHRLRWWLVPVFWLWGCCHPLWMFGLLLGAVMSVFLAVRPRDHRPDRRNLVALNVACAAVLAITPLGPRLLTVPFDVAGNAAWIAEEWRATPLNNVFAFATLGLFLVTALLWVRRPQARPPWQYAVLALGLGMALWMWRLVPLACILGAPLFASALQHALGRPAELRGRREWRVVALAGLVAALVAAGTAAGPKGAAAQTYPGRMDGVSARLDALPAGTVVLNDFGVSGWLLWEHPDLHPVVDLRVEIYSAEYLRSFIRTEQVRPGWQDFIARVQPDVALVARDSALGDALVHRLGWRPVASSKDFVLLAPDSP
ncbi:hypothetical protein ABEG17_02990 [Pedococcus sp. KACC 23699]|uniref:Glycosyltransferase RgtA/B/C/D-like domain-containing protein n=1 Tax=Pedococcus sp. KACC 23699 TaxID=3149228 RepID=A0AAU7JV63_9MICO